MQAMARLPLPRRARQVPWQAVLALALQIAQEGRKRWNRLSAREQRAVRDAIARSRGRLDRLNQREREELRRIVWKAVGPQ
jgi:TRAP-type C4-dicarboxylate transport system substrate-binding protein